MKELSDILQDLLIYLVLRKKMKQGKQTVYKVSSLCEKTGVTGGFALFVMMI